MPKVVLVGSPNVGKSVIFNYLTGTYVAVSNYPGTTVDIARGQSNINGKLYEVIDTPGMYSFIPLTEEERVTRHLLCQEKPDVVVHVIDAKNIRRMLPLTLQLLDAGLPVILNLNIMDEARDLGVWIQIAKIADMLGIPVIATAATKKLGLRDLKNAIGQYQYRQALSMRYAEDIEQVLTFISAKLVGNYGLSSRMTALSLLQGDDMLQGLLQEEPAIDEIVAAIREVASHYQYNMSYVLTTSRQVMVDKIINCTVRYGKAKYKGIAESLGRWTREPLTGLPILCLILYLGLYQFVGKFGAGFLVDYVDTVIFKQFVNPIIQSIVYQYVAGEWLPSLLVGEYGIVTLGFRYAVAIILPIVGTFFLVFSVLEDCGYLPRLAMLVDRLFHHFGLNGRAVIPFTLGLGCGTMAVMVTRTLETRRERILATFLLSVAIPCSAQLGVVLALLSRDIMALSIWIAYIVLIFIVIGWLSARIMPGNRSAFYIEIPPLRIPLLSNVITKAYTRMSWYFMEILPIFIITSLIMWLGDRSGILTNIIQMIMPLMALLGLPVEAAQAFLLGFFRRDYGAAGLYDMCLNGVLDNKQLLVAAVTLTLFIPCVAQLAVMVKERGLIVSGIMVTVILLLSFFAGWVLHQLLSALPIYV
ncbi:MAG TPA: ferrous iron transport protein B [Negativicutes bacterium]